MATPAESRQHVQFAEFALDLRTGELWRGGEKLVLAYQSFQILTALLERPGALVTREELVKRLWASDVFVDFEGSLNKAIKRLRETLLDSADQPRFIETLPRRGYRFMAAVAITRDPAAETKGVIGKKVSHYRVLEVIGGGGMGLVYKAEDLKLGRRVALKFLPEELDSDPTALQRFEREAQTASSLNHPNICTIYAVEEHDEQPFIVMELLEGETLRDRLAALAQGQHGLPFDELLHIAVQVTDGLRAAHEQGIIHRDIKPANIFLTRKGTAKILDFGLAKLAVTGMEIAGLEVLERRPPRDSPANDFADKIEYTLTRTGAAMGTAGYMSPEQVRGEKLDSRTDLFSFGLILYEMATGQRAFTGETAAVVQNAIVSRTPAPVRGLNRELPPGLETVIGKALEKERERRYQTAAEMRAELERVSGGKRRIGGLHPWVWSVAAALMVAVGVLLYQHAANTAKLNAGDTIVLADFSNSTTDPIFDDVLNTALRVELEQTPFLNPLSPDKVRGTLKQMGRSENERLTPDLARDVCKDTNSKASLAASISDVGNHYGIELRATDCRSGKLIAKEYKEAETRNSVVSTVGIAGDELRRKLGEPIVSIQKFHKPLEQALSPSPEALQSYSLGFSTFYNRGDEKALPYFERAVQLDPNFAAAHVKLGFVYNEREQPALASLHGTKAYELRDRVTTRQRLFIEYFYNGFVTGDFNETTRALTEWAKTYPARRPSADLAFYLRALGRFPEAAFEGEEAIRADPSDGTAVGNVGMAYLAMNRLDDAKEVLKAAAKRGLDNVGIHRIWYWLAFLRNDMAAIDRELEWGKRREKSGDLSPFMSMYEDTLAYYGHLGKARVVLDQMIAFAVARKRTEMAAGFTSSGAVNEAMLGNFDRARKAAADSLTLSQGPYVKAQAAFAFALGGECSRAEPLVAELSRQFRLNTMMQSYDLPMIRAACLIKADPAHAAEMLSVAEPYELGGYFNWNLQVVYVRGLAYLQSGEAKQAAAEFQKVIDHSGIVLTSVHGAIARLQLGRAQAMMGDKAAARRSYQDFLALWKDADPDIPICRQAKVEYAKLQ